MFVNSKLDFVGVAVLFRSILTAQGSKTLDGLEVSDDFIEVEFLGWKLILSRDEAELKEDELVFSLSCTSIGDASRTIGVVGDSVFTVVNELLGSSDKLGGLESKELANLKTMLFDVCQTVIDCNRKVLPLESGNAELSGMVQYSVLGLSLVAESRVDAVELSLKKDQAASGVTLAKIPVEIRKGFSWSSESKEAL